MSHNLFNSLQQFQYAGKTGKYYSLPALEKAGLKPELAELTMKPTAEAGLAGADAARMRQLLDALENLDDVQNVYTTAVVD